MKKFIDDSYVFTGAGNIPKARLRLFHPEEQDSEQSIVLVLSYSPEDRSDPVPIWATTLVSQTLQVLQGKGRQFLVFVHFPESVCNGVSAPAQVGVVEWKESEGAAIVPIYRRSFASKLESLMGEPLDSPWPSEKVRTLVLMDLLPTDQVYSFVDRDGIEWHWSASLGLRLIALAPREPQRFYPRDARIDLPHLRRRYPEIDEGHAAQADLSRPILFVPFHDGTSVLIDGWHRLWRAVSEGVEWLPCYELTAAEARHCLLARMEPGKGIL